MFHSVSLSQAPFSTRVPCSTERLVYTEATASLASVLDTPLMVSSDVAFTSVHSEKTHLKKLMLMKMMMIMIIKNKS